jgi:hypothetical protein
LTFTGESQTTHDRLIIQRMDGLSSDVHELLDQMQDLTSDMVTVSIMAARTYEIVSDQATV